MHQYRTHTCGALRQSDVDAKVRLSGWVHRKRDHGNLLFLDLRDHYGLTQIVVDTSHEVFPILEGLSNESTVCVTGRVLQRSDETINPNMQTGAIEVAAEQVEILSVADPLPMPVNKDAGYPEDIRLQNRFLDLRREEMQKNIILRAEIISSIRRRMIDQGFREYQTPILTASSPEGARDFLVPSRLHPGKFYALPQAPQQFKQLLMMAGFDRYFQIAPCFRDEDARADRSPGEFYQLDFEMSFVTQEDVFDALEPVLHGLFVEFANGRQVCPTPFKRIPYRESMEKYGTDKPDLRNPLIIYNVSEAFAGSDFKIFANLIEKGMVVKAVPVPDVSDRPRSFFDKLNNWAQSEGQAGLGYINFKQEGAAGPIARNLDAARLGKIKKITGAKEGDSVFFVAGEEKAAAEFACLTRSKLANDLALIDENRFDFCWIVDFPMFKYDEKSGKIDFSHNPFSMPQGGMEALQSQAPLTINAYQYDIVCNGVELSSGAIRNHLPEVMYKAFAIAGYGPEIVDGRFGGLINALKLGPPPHGGSAPGIDRIVMLLAGTENIREVTAFPMNQMAQDLMMGAPAVVDQQQLQDVHIKIRMPEEALDN